MNSIFYGEGPQGQLLSGVHEFLELETGVGIPLPTNNVIKEWESDPSIFGETLGLGEVLLDIKDKKFRVLSAFLLLEQGEAMLRLDAASALKEHRNLYDPFAELFIRDFVGRLTSHAHRVCIDQASALREADAKLSTKLVALKDHRTGEIIFQ